MYAIKFKKKEYRPTLNIEKMTNYQNKVLGEITRC